MWGIGLAVFAIVGLIWVGCMHNGFGFLDGFWLVVAGIAGVIAGVGALDSDPFIVDGWNVAPLVALAVFGVILGIKSLDGSAGIGWWIICWILLLGNIVHYAASAYEEEVGW